MCVCANSAPSRRFEKAARKRSRQFARSVKELAGNPAEVEREVLAALSDYKRLAEWHESAYLLRYDEALF